MKAELREVFRKMQIEEFAAFCEETGADMYKLVRACLTTEKKYYIVVPQHANAPIVNAIKAIRQETGCGLKEAKDLVDSHRISDREFGPFEFEITNSTAHWAGCSVRVEEK